MKQINGFVILSLIFTLAYFVGLIKFLSENDEDKCEMTYMFEYPQYVKISNKADKEFKKYGLYAYSEGRHTEKTRNMRFDGIPVLFIPGNAGSHKQVRSLSSVALRKWLNSRMPFHFDYFTVDLNEEYSGLYGPLLYDQLQYVKSSLYRVLELYQNRQYPPESVVIIGHSMGGVIAMKLLSELQEPELVPILITLASPLRRPLLSLDYNINRFYDGIFNYNTNTTNIISLAGGYKDFLIAPFLTGKRENSVMHTETTHIPMSWTECNHVQILWCKQVVLALNRALFDSVDSKTHQISTNTTYRDMVFRHYLVKNSGTKIKNRENYFDLVQMNTKGQWIENLRKVYSIEFPNGVSQPQWHMIALSDFPGYELLSILAINLEVSDWVYVCNAYYFRQSSRICQEGFHLSHKSEIAPSVRYKRRFFDIDMAKLKKYRKDLTHIVFRIAPTDEPLEYHVDIHGSDQRFLTVDLPGWFSFYSKVVLDKTEANAIYYQLSLPELNHISQYYRLLVEPMDCSKIEHHASITLTIPWSNEDYHGFITNNMKKPFNIRLFSSKPADMANSSAVIKLILDPLCRYQISVQSSIFGVLGQLARIYSPLLLANIAAVALMSLRYQLKNLKNGHCSILFVAIQEGAKLYYILPAYNLLSRVLSFKFLPDVLLKPDYLYLVNDGIDFFLLPPLLYVCSVGIFWILVIIFSVSLIAMESTVHKLSLKLLARTVSFNMAFSDYLMSYLHKVPVVVALTLISLSLTTCGGIALCLGVVFYFLRLTQMSQDFVEEIVWYVVKKAARKCKNYFFKSKTKNKSSNRTNATTPSQIANSTRAMITNTEDINAEEMLTMQIELCDGDVDKSIEDPDTTENSEGTSIARDTKTVDNLIDKSTETNSSRGTQVKDGINSQLYDDSDKSIRFEDLQELEDKPVDQEVQTKSTTVVGDYGDCRGNDAQNEEIPDDNISQSEGNDKSRLEDIEIIDLTDKTISKVEQNMVVDQISNEKTEDKKDSKEPHVDKEPEFSAAYNAIFFHSTLFFLWCIVAIINVPPVLTWAHNFKYSTILEYDSSFIPGLALSVCALILWQFDFPKTNRKWIDQLETFVMLMAIFSLVFASISIYRLNYILTITIIVVTLHQLFAPQLEETEIEDDAGDKPNYDDLKMKME